MRTFLVDEGTPQVVRFHYNSDLSGDVTIGKGEKTFTIPANALLQFVANFIRDEKIARIESAGDMQILMGDI